MPVIDCTGLLSGVNWPRPHIVKQIEKACREWGFFQIINTGVPQELIEQQFAAAARQTLDLPFCCLACTPSDCSPSGLRSFFSSPAAVKHACKRTPDNAWGFADDELTKQKLDLKVGIFCSLASTGIAWRRHDQALVQELFDFGRIPDTRLPDDHPDNRHAAA